MGVLLGPGWRFGTMGRAMGPESCLGRGPEASDPGIRGQRGCPPGHLRAVGCGLEIGRSMSSSSSLSGFLALPGGMQESE